MRMFEITLFTVILMMYSKVSCQCDKDILIWLAFDGFANDYFTNEYAPFMYELSRKGMYSFDGLGPSFTTLTFPNMFTLATGLYVESHGIIANGFTYNNMTFEYDSRDEYWYNQYNTTVPIWIANEMSPNGHKSAVLHWVGSLSTYNERIPSFRIDPYKSEKTSTIFNKLYDKVISCEYNLIMGYFHEIDSTGHNHGLSDNEYINSIKNVDALFESFYTKLQENANVDKVTFIVTSDHGMQNIFIEKTYFVEDYTNLTYSSIKKGPVGLLTTKGNKTRAKLIVDSLNTIDSDIWKAYLKEDVPTEYHFSNNDRIPEIVVVVEDGWCLLSRRRDSQDQCMLKGNHGYPFQISQKMKAIFFAVGGKLPIGRQLMNVKNVDVYPLACKLLDVEKYCHKHNGTLSIFGLTSNNDKKYIFIIVIGVLLSILVLVVIITTTILLTRKKQEKLVVTSGVSMKF